MKKAAQIIVKGTVQGVFFRNFIVEHATNLDLKGFVRNLESGDVEIFVEGEPETIKKFYDRIHKGPTHSQIRDIQTEEKKWTGDFKDFKILRI